MKRIAAFCIATLLTAGLLAGCVGTSKVNYAGNSTSTSWSASYQKFDGTEEKTVTIPAGAIVRVTVTNESGYLDIAFESHEGQSAVVPYQGSYPGAPKGPVVEISFVAEDGGAYTITLVAGEHRGGFAFAWN